jgi:hypothetical protein
MACIREYMHYPAMQKLEGASMDSDEVYPVNEKGWTYEVRVNPCSDPENCSSEEEHWRPYEISNGSDDYTLDEEGPIREDSEQSDDDHSYEGSDVFMDSGSEASTSDEIYSDLDSDSENYVLDDESQDDSYSCDDLYGSDESY